MVSRTTLEPHVFTDQPMLLLPEYVILRHGPVTDYAVLVKDGLFADVGPVSELQLRYHDTKQIPLPRAALMPGFIDTHHLLTQDLVRR
ncbi:amidohydrolase family protein [Halalkalibacter lacteus]|uniref:amidohydrolase family protein n=1 Tax=Halalkalibacter lacteus TaxID=3090663 RepID=UPI002FCB6204